MARPRNPKSKTPYGGLGLAPEKEIALKRCLEEAGGLSLAAFVRFAIEKELKTRGYVR